MLDLIMPHIQIADDSATGGGLMKLIIQAYEAKGNKIYTSGQIEIEVGKMPNTKTTMLAADRAVQEVRDKMLAETKRPEVG